MKNITVTVPDEIYLIARVWAARRGTSVSAVVRQFLETLDDLPEPECDLPEREIDTNDTAPPPLFTVNL
jgi:hypothetical protein